MKAKCDSVYTDDDGRQFFCSLEAGHYWGEPGRLHCALSLAGQWIYEWPEPR